MENDPLNFNASTYSWRRKKWFSCPDNLALLGNSITSDMSGYFMNKIDGPYMPFKNNSLFVIPRYGNYAGKVIRVASAPRDGIYRSLVCSRWKSLFLSVQHELLT